MLVSGVFRLTDKQNFIKWHFSTSVKEGIIGPPHKKSDVNEINNYRPVTNLKTVSKLAEKILKRLMSHLTINTLWLVHQSAYRKGYSTESGVPFCSEIIAKLLSEGKIVLLIALDLSSAFDSVDFTILLSILERCLGIKGTVLKLFTTYLHNRKTRVVIEDK